jgi:hypothetical protein
MTHDVCLGCGDVIESKHRHDIVYCSCGKTMVDGGTRHLRRGWDDAVGFEEMSEYEPAKEPHHGE